MKQEFRHAVKRPMMVGGSMLAIFAVIAFAALYLAPEPQVPIVETPTTSGMPTAQASAAPEGFLYGRVTAGDGTVYEGRLRWGGNEEAFWGDSFNGFKDQNPWLDHLPTERLIERRSVTVFGVEIAEREHRLDFGRPFMARFGDIARIESTFRDVLVTLKSGSEFHLDRFNADDLADGLRVWDVDRGVVDLGERSIRSVELLAGDRPGAVPGRLYGTVYTSRGDFTGFIQWNRNKGVGTDRLEGRSADGELNLRFDTIRSIARQSRTGSLVTLLDGRRIEISGTRDAGRDHRGVYVEDPRYGRVLISWQAFDRVDFSPGGSGPAYREFPVGQPLMGSVTTRAGRRLTGRLVYDLDESETTETLDAPAQGVNYSIPFGLIASIELPDRHSAGADQARLKLHSGEDLRLERTGDLGRENAGMLIFVDGGESAEYLPWAELETLELERPEAMYPPLEARR